MSLISTVERHYHYTRNYVFSTVVIGLSMLLIWVFCMVFFAEQGNHDAK